MRRSGNSDIPHNTKSKYADKKTGSKKRVSKWYSETEGSAFIIRVLKKHATSCPQNELTRKHDPVMMLRVLEQLVSNGTVLHNINDKAVGSARHVYTLKDNNHGS